MDGPERRGSGAGPYKPRLHPASHPPGRDKTIVEMVNADNDAVSIAAPHKETPQENARKR
jgi:hypothetical protein